MRKIRTGCGWAWGQAVNGEFANSANRAAEFTIHRLTPKFTIHRLTPNCARYFSGIKTTLT